MTPMRDALAPVIEALLRQARLDADAVAGAAEREAARTVADARRDASAVAADATRQGRRRRRRTRRRPGRAPAGRRAAGNWPPGGRPWRTCADGSSRRCGRSAAIPAIPGSSTAWANWPVSRAARIW